MAAFGDQTDLWRNIQQSQNNDDFKNNNPFSNLDQSNAGNPFLRQRLEMLWSQALQFQQRSSETADSEAQKNQAFQENKAQEIMQKLLTDHATSRAQLPWPSLTSLASQSAGNTYLNAGRIPEANQELGNLLPPPPMLSMSPTQQQNTLDNNVQLRHNAIALKPDAIDLTPNTSDSKKDPEKVQPLDLTTSTSKRNLSQDLTVPVMHSTPLKQPDPNPVQNSPFSNVFAPFQQSLANQSALSTLTPQQLTALAPFLQNSARLPTNLYNQNMMQPLNPEYLQKWLQMAQSRQHLQQQVRVQQPQRKRQKLNGYNAVSNSNQRSAAFPTLNISQNHFVNNNNNRPTMTSQSRSKPNASPSAQAPTQQQNSSGKRYKRYAKPPYSYVSLITLSILSSPEKKLRLSQILKRISEMFPFFNGSYQGWRDSVRHNLSQNECFVKVLKNPFRPTAKGNYWTVNITTIPHELLLRQNTLVSRYAQDSGYRYRKDLTEVFDLTNGQVKINIPRHLFNGLRLVEDPAAVMEALLLEEKMEDPSMMSQGPDNVGMVSLHDMFNQDDIIEEDLLRQQGGAGNRWNKIKPRVQQTTPDKYPSVTSQASVLSNPYYHQYMNNLAPRTLAMQMLQQSPTNVISGGSELQNSLISRALALQTSVVNSLPVLKNYYSQTGENKAEIEKEDVKAPEVATATEVKTEEHCDDINSAWDQVEKRSRRKGVHPIKRRLSAEIHGKGNPTSPPTSAVDSGIVGSLSPRSFSSSEEQESVSNLAASSPVRSRSSDVSTSDTVTSEEMMSPPGKFAMPFSLFNSAALPAALDTGKLM